MTTRPVKARGRELAWAGPPRAADPTLSLLSSYVGLQIISVKKFININHMNVLMQLENTMNSSKGFQLRFFIITFILKLFVVFLLGD